MCKSDEVYVMDNVKEQRFKRVAALRVQKVLDSLENLCKCANRGNYQYAADDVRKMLNAIKAKVRGLEQAYSNEGRSKSEKFQF